MKLRVLTFLVIFLTLACNEEVPEVILDAVSDYYPININDYRIYRVEKINHEITGSDTLNYFLKEKIIDSLISANNQKSYVLEYSSAQDSLYSWQVDSVSTVRYKNSGLIVVENNTAYQKLAYPVSIGTTWDGNAFNVHSTQAYSYQKVENFTGNSFLDNSSIQVVIANTPKNSVLQDERFEFYSRGIGLVEKNYIALKFNTTSGEVGTIDSGFELFQVLIDHGQE